MTLLHVRLRQSLVAAIAIACLAGAARAQVSTDTVSRDSTRINAVRPDSTRRDSVRRAPPSLDWAGRDSAARVSPASPRPDWLALPDWAARDSAFRDSAKSVAPVLRDSTAMLDSAVVTDSAAVRETRLPNDSTAVESARAVTRDAARAGESASLAVPASSINVVLPSGRSFKDSLELAAAVRYGLSNPAWRRPQPTPLEGAILPAKRIVAFYGSTLSRRMGILGQYPPDTMLAKLDAVVAEWQAADPTTPVQPALHLVAVVAQADAGKDGKYRLRMDSAAIEKAYEWAKRRHALLFLDIQAGHSSVMEEIPLLARFLERPDVHLGIDPEFNMQHVADSIAPGKQIGFLRATEVNFAVEYLAKLVVEKNLPPKVLVVHRFREPMVRDVKNIKLDPHVQVVMHMDGWGVPAVKFGSYQRYIVSEPVQFTGFKLFYRHDTQFGDKLITPLEILQLWPRPVYIQYQ